LLGGTGTISLWKFGRETNRNGKPGRSIGPRDEFILWVILAEVGGRRLTSFTAIPLTEKLRLIRALVEQRTKEGFFGRLFLDGKNVDDETVMGTPEATVVTIVETYYSLLASGLLQVRKFTGICRGC
jgi:hypothetical protein